MQRLPSEILASYNIKLWLLHLCLVWLSGMDLHLLLFAVVGMPLL
jgi:hypothetical protein